MMIVVHENVGTYAVTKPMNCPRCGHKRTFDVPREACVRKSKRGKPPIEDRADIVLLKCRKCGHSLGVSTERG